MSCPLILHQVEKSFTMHLRGGVQIPVVAGVTFSVDAGCCSVLAGPSGIGKSSILKMIYGNYSVNSGQILVAHEGSFVDITTAVPRSILNVRRHSLGYVSQFLRTIPRVSTLDVVAQPFIDEGHEREFARAKAEVLLMRLNLPEALWELPPSTFSGGEQQRVNIARGFITSHPVLLLDEPTASLDAANRQVVIDMIKEKKAAGTAMLGIFHDHDVREAIADEQIDVGRYSARTAA